MIQKIRELVNSGKWSHVFSENVWIVVWGVTMANSFLLQEAEINFHITALPPFYFYCLYKYVEPFAAPSWDIKIVVVC